METLKEKFIYEFNPDNLADMFEKLFRKLHAIHFDGKYIPNLSMANIAFDDNNNVHLVNATPIENVKEIKGQNIRALAKIMIGCYLSQGTLFNDLSYTDDSWFVDNLDTIFQCINYPSVDKEYFYSIFVDKKDEYYSDYLNNKREHNSLAGLQEKGFVKTLKTAASMLYNDNSKELEQDIQQKDETNWKMSAKLHTAFNPLLIGVSIATIAVITIMAILLN